MEVFLRWGIRNILCAIIREVPEFMAGWGGAVDLEGEPLFFLRAQLGDGGLVFKGRLVYLRVGQGGYFFVTCFSEKLHKTLYFFILRGYSTSHFFQVEL